MAFKIINMEAEYKILLTALAVVEELGAKKVEVNMNSHVMVNQAIGR